MSVNLNFWVRPSQKTSNGKTPVYLNISYNGVKCQYSIGVETVITQWDKKAQRIKGKSDEANLGNAKLVAIRTRTMNIFNELLMSGEPFNAHTIKDKLVHGMVRDITVQHAFEEFLAYMQKLKGKEYCQPTIFKYKNTLDRVNEFIQFQYKREYLYLYELDYSFITNFSAWLKSKYDNSNNTVYKHYQRLSKVIHVSMNKGYLNHFPFGQFSIRQDKTNLVYLTVEEIKRIEEKVFSTPRLEQVKKIFLLSCYCGLSFKELENLRKEHVFTGEDDIHWLTMVRQKTKKQLRIVLLPQAYRLIEELQQLKPTNKQKPSPFLPMLSNQKYNSYLKEIADQCGIGKTLSSHVGRKSFCNLALRMGLPIDMVSKLLGHSSLSVTMAHYNAISEERMIDDIRDLSNRIMATNSIHRR